MKIAPIDFARKPGQPLLGWFLLVAGLALVLWSAQVAWLRQQLQVQAQQEFRREAAAKEEAEQKALAAMPKPRPPYFEDKRWQRAAQQLTFPWVASLVAVEQTVKPPVYLLALRSAPEAGQLSLEGEAPDLDPVLAFVARLQAEPQLKETTLLTHEETADLTGRMSVHFSVQTQWVNHP